MKLHKKTKATVKTGYNFLKRGILQSQIHIITEEENPL